MTSKFHRHFFVCTFDRPDGGRGSCGGSGGGALLSRMQAALFSRPDLWPTVSVTQAGCMGLCLQGPAMVVYPDGIWYTGVTTADAEEIIREHLFEGRVVERLVYRWPDAQ